MIDIPKLLPLVQREFPGVPQEKILKAMGDFANAHPDLSNEEAVQAFQLGLQSARQPTPQAGRFQGLMRALPTGAR